MVISHDTGSQHDINAYQDHADAGRLLTPLTSFYVIVYASFSAGTRELRPGPPQVTQNLFKKLCSLRGLHYNLKPAPTQRSPTYLAPTLSTITPCSSLP